MVPSTYAAGVASLAVWRKRPQPAPTPIEAPGHLFCECGGVRRNHAAACARCTQLDAKRDRGALVEAVFRALDTDEPMTAGDVVEACSYKIPKYTVTRILRELAQAGRATALPGKPHAGGARFVRR